MAYDSDAAASKTGMVLKGIGGFYYVKTDTGIFECKARGIFRKINSQSPMPGDNVEISVMEDTLKKRGNIIRIFKRTSQLIRPAVANLTQVVIVTSVTQPQPDFMLIDKLLISAHCKNLKCVICVNKIDLEPNFNMIKEYADIGYQVIYLSCADDYKELNKLQQVLANNISVLAGQSGVGKSTILNGIVGKCVMEEGMVSSKIGRGKHTTRHAEVVELQNGGFIVDTPGFSCFELSGIHNNQLHLYYPEFQQYIGLCKFRGCSHTKELGCAIKQQVQNLSISQRRYNSYVELYNYLRIQDRNAKYHTKNYS